MIIFARKERLVILSVSHSEVHSVIDIFVLIYYLRPNFYLQKII